MSSAVEARDGDGRDTKVTGTQTSFPRANEEASGCPSDATRTPSSFPLQLPHQAFHRRLHLPCNAIVHKGARTRIDRRHVSRRWRFAFRRERKGYRSLHGKLVLGPEWHTSRGSTQGVLPRIPGGSRADEFSFVLSGSREYLCVGRAADAGTGVMGAAREANVSYWSWS